MIKQSKPKTFDIFDWFWLGVLNLDLQLSFAIPLVEWFRCLLHMASCTSRYIWGISQKKYLAFKQLQVPAWACHRCSPCLTNMQADPPKTSGKPVAIPTLCRQPQLTCVMRCGNLSGGWDVWSCPSFASKSSGGFAQLARSNFFCFFILRKQIEQLNCSKIQLFWK